MKELPIEEKAKRFDEALEKARRYYDEYVSRDNILYVEDMEDMFPELKESEGEDESIRKYLYSFIELNSGVNLPPEEAKKILAWLEKQGEQPTNKEMKELLRTEYEKGRADAIAEIQKPTEFNDFNAKQMFIKALERVEEQNSKGYKLTDCDKNSWWEDFKFYTLCSIMQNHAWSEKYIADVFEKVGLAKIVREQSNDNLTNALQDAMIELSKFIPQPNSAWSEEDKNGLDDTLWAIKQARTIAKDENDMGNLWYAERWIKSLKDRVQSQSIVYYNPYKEVVESIAEMCKHYDKASHSGLRDFYDNVKVKCKDAKEYEFLFPHSTWKPSEHELEVLRLVAEKDGTCLMDLYKQLKKLKD